MSDAAFLVSPRWFRTPERRPGPPLVHELKAGECHYPIAYDEGHRFCGRPRKGLRPYCEEHAALCRASGKEAT